MCRWSERSEGPRLSLELAVRCQLVYRHTEIPENEGFILLSLILVSDRLRLSLRSSAQQDPHAEAFVQSSDRRPDLR